MKRLLVILCLFLIFYAVSFAQTDEIQLTLNGQPVELTSPIRQTESGHFLVPMDEFFGLLQIPVDELPTRHLGVFRDNIYVKFRLDSPYYELNGREFRWTNLPTRRGDVAYIEIDVFLKYMDLAYTFNESKQLLELRSTRALDLYRPDAAALKQVPSLRTGLRYSVPNFWTRQDPGYGATILGQKIVFHLEKLPSNMTGIEDAITDFLALPRLNLTDFEVMPVRYYDTNLFRVTWYRYHSSKPLAEDSGQTENLLLGFFELNQQYFAAILESNLGDPPYLEQLFQDILDSVQSGTYSIDSLSEHYVEFRNYSENRTFISTPIYSNIRTAGQLPFRGNINPDIEYLDVIVKKGPRSFEYQIPVTYGSFDQSIPIPFGLGFHQVTIMLPDNVPLADDFYLEEDNRTLIKLSVINRTLGESLLVSSSKLVNKNHELVLAAVSDIPDDRTNYDKAEAAFAKLDQFSLSQHETIDQLLSDQSGNSQAVAAVYTSYLRAMNIPSRILKTHFGSEYYVEFFSNGKWVFTRPGNYVRAKDDPRRYFDVERPQGIRIDLLDY